MRLCNRYPMDSILPPVYANQPQPVPITGILSPGVTDTDLTVQWPNGEPTVNVIETLRPTGSYWPWLIAAIAAVAVLRR